jgi:putative transposase
MAKSSYRKASHCVFSIHLHIYFVPKYRRHVFDKAMVKRMEEIFTRVLEKNKCLLEACGTEDDHIHILIDLHPDNNISNLVGSLKSASSRILRKEFAEELSKFYWKKVLWGEQYFVASTGGAPIEVLKQYIQQQDSPVD